MTSATTGVRSRAGRTAPALARAVLTSLMAVALLVAVPVALARFVGNPLPTVVPSADEVTFAVTHGQIDTWTWVKAFALVAWLAWAYLAAGFVVEAATVLRLVRARHWPGLGVARRLSARLISQWTLVASLAVQASGPGPLAALPSFGVATALVAGFEGHPAPMPASVEPDISTGTGTGAEIVVARHETLWGLAATHLGAGGRWEAIRDANVGRTMPDGAVLSPDFTRLQPGWRLRLPPPDHTAPAADGTRRLPVAGSSASSGALAPSEIVVAQGDSLWALAESRFDAVGSDAPVATVAGYVASVVDHNRDRIDDPDLIFPGQRLMFPAFAPSVEAPVEAPSATTPAALDTPTLPGVADGPAAPEPRAEGPATVRVDEVSAHEPAGPEAESGVDAEDLVVPVTAPVLGVGGAVLAAGALDLVRRRRRYRLAHRRPHTVPAHPDRGLEPVEQALRGQADLDMARWLHRALASLSARPIWEGEAVAQPVLIRIGADQLEVVVSHPDPMAAPLPWTTPDGGTTWLLSRSVAGAELPGANADVPTPSLVTIGEGTLLNLEAVGVFAVSGLHDGPHDLVRSLVHELATSLLSAPVDIRTTFGIAGTGAYDLVRRMAPNDLVAELVPWLDDIGQRLDRDSISSVYAHRLAGPEEPIAPVVIVADWTSRAALQPLLSRAAAVSLPLAVVIVDPLATDEARLEIEDGVGLLHPWGLSVPVQALSHTRAVELGALVADVIDAPDEPLLTGLRLSAPVTELRRRPEPEISTTATDPMPAIDALSLGESAVVVGEPVPTPADSDARPGPTNEEPVSGAQPVVSIEEPGTAESQPEPGVRTEGDLSGPEVRDAPSARVLVLGPVAVDGLPSDLTSQQLSLLCYLAYHGGATRSALIEAIWDGQQISASRFPNLLTELRSRIGRNLFPEARDGRYALEHVTTDLADFEHGVAAAARQEGAGAVETLRAALELVRGIPLTPPSSRFWSWVGDVSHEAARLESMVADAAVRLARLEQGRGNLEGARWACQQGLEASPIDETLVATLTEIYVAEGKAGLARRLVEGWEARISRLECGEPSDEPRRRLAGGR